ncbi:MAG: hypothetical protein H0W88_07890 [Parachlamydiaceae bacterium]|nr:hypothetical protein [Parachlamydiaceae bacterium]
MDINPISFNKIINNKVELGKNINYEQFRGLLGLVALAMFNHITNIVDDFSRDISKEERDFLNSARNSIKNLELKQSAIRTSLSNNDPDMKKLLNDEIELLSSIPQFLQQFPNLGVVKDKTIATYIAIKLAKINSFASGYLNLLKHILDTGTEYLESDLDKINKLLYEETLLDKFKQIAPNNKSLIQDQIEFENARIEFSSNPPLALKNLNEYLAQRITDLYNKIKNLPGKEELLQLRSELEKKQSKIKELELNLLHVEQNIKIATRFNDTALRDESLRSKTKFEKQKKAIEDEISDLPEQIKTLSDQIEAKIKKLSDQGYIADSRIGSLNYFKELNNLISNYIRELGGDPISNKEIAHKKFGNNDSIIIKHKKNTLSKKLTRLIKHLKI